MVRRARRRCRSSLKSCQDGAPEARRPGPGGAWPGADSGVCTRAKRITLFWIWEHRRCGFIFFREGFMILPVPWSRAVRRSSRSVWEIRTRCRNWELRRRKKNREETDEENLAAVLEEQYRTRAVQVMRVLNFYSFNNVNNTIGSLYYCGGGARYGN